MERVATRAGAGKASLYARWPNRVALVRAAATHHAETTRRPADFSGDLGEDLLSVLRGAAAFNAGPFGEALRGMVAEPTAPDAEGLTIFSDRRPVQVVLDIVVEAQRTGRLAPGAIPTRVMNLGLTLVSHYFLINGETPADDELTEILTGVWLPLLEVTRAGETS